MAELGKIWPGKALKENLRIAQWFFKSFSDEDTIEHLESNGLGSHPLVIKAIYDVASQMSSELERLKKNEDRISRPLVAKYPELTQKEIEGFEVKARELLNSELYKAEQQVISKHGPIG
jgi:hypothetical protein